MGLAGLSHFVVQDSEWQSRAQPIGEEAANYLWQT
jgi:hypothetical protein